MKLSVKPILLKLLTLAAGGLGLMLRIVLYATGIDEKGLLIAGHWAGTSLWLISVMILAALFVLTRPIRGARDYRNIHPVSLTAGLGAFAASFGFVYTAIGELGMQSTAVMALTFASALALAFIGFCRISRMKPHFLCHAVLCVFFALRMVSKYQGWNSDPQVLDYVFYLGAYVALMLTAYLHAAIDTGMGRQRELWLMSLIAVYLCMVSLMDTMDTWLLLGCAVWALTNLPNMKFRIRRRRTAAPEQKGA